MIHVKTCFAAEGVVTDRDTNQISAFGLIDDVQAASFPTSLPRIALLCVWERALTDSPQHGAELSVTLNGKDLVRQIIDVRFAQFLRTRTAIRFESLTLAEPGNLVFRLAVPGHAVAEWVIVASVAAPVAPGTVSAAGTSRVYDSGDVSISVGSADVNHH